MWNKNYILALNVHRDCDLKKKQDLKRCAICFIKKYNNIRNIALWYRILKQIFKQTIMLVTIFYYINNIKDISFKISIVFLPFYIYNVMYIWLNNTDVNINKRDRYVRTSEYGADEHEKSAKRWKGNLAIRCYYHAGHHQTALNLFYPQPRYGSRAFQFRAQATTQHSLFGCHAAGSATTSETNYSCNKGFPWQKLHGWVITH